MSFTVTVGEVIDYDRFWLGNLSTAIISDDDLTRIINNIMTDTTLSDCDVYYKSTVEILRNLIRRDAAGSAGSVGGGALKKKTEEVGTLRITEEFDVGTSSGTANGWDKVLEDLLANPSTIGCAITATPVTGTSASGSVIIGGVSQAAHDKARNNPDARTAYDVEVPYKTSLRTTWLSRHKH